MTKVMGSCDQHLMSPSGTPSVSALWIDDSGREIPHKFIALGLEARRRAFKYMRMVEVLRQGHHLVVRWNVKHASPQAISTAAVILAESGMGTCVTLEFFWGGWSRERGYSPSNALRRIIDIAPYATVEPFLGTKILSRDPANVRKEGDLIRDTFEHWDTKIKPTADVGPDGMGAYSKYSLGFSYDTSETNIMVRHVGRSATAVSIFGDEWATTAVGRPCSRSQPDYEFEDRVCVDYANILSSGELQIDHIRALIRRADNDPVWVTYKRLLMRTRNPMGVPTLVSMTEWADDIDIPLMAA